MLEHCRLLPDLKSFQHNMPESRLLIKTEDFRR